MEQILEKFKTSIYYPGGGTDLQVLLRLSDISATVISPTLSSYLTLNRYDRLFKRKCDDINDYYGQKIISYKGFTKLNSKIIEENKDFKFLPGLFSNSEIHEYENFFDFWIKNNKYDVTQFHFDRYIGDTVRPLSWIALKTEGIATLNALVNLTKESPQILCTIQSGTMELPKSFFSKLLRSLNLSTKIWIRGYWNAEGYENNHISLSSFPPYHLPFHKYEKWFSPMGVQGIQNEENHSDDQLSRVMAFSNSKNLLLNTPDVLTLKHGKNQNRIITLRTSDLQDKLNHYDVVITKNSILPADSPNQHNWESLIDSTRDDNSKYPVMTFVECLEKIKNDFCYENNKKIAIVPIGFEDEILCLKRFLNECDSDFQLDIFSLSPFDILKIKIAEQMGYFKSYESDSETENMGAENVFTKEMFCNNFNKILQSNHLNTVNMNQNQENCPLYQKHHNKIDGIYTLLKPRTWEEIPLIDDIDAEDEEGELLAMLNDLNVYFTKDYPELTTPKGRHGIPETIFIMIHKEKFYLVETQGEDCIKFATEITNLPWIQGLKKELHIDR